MERALLVFSDVVWGFNWFWGLILPVFWSEFTNDIGDLLCEDAEIICSKGGVDFVELVRLSESCFGLVGFKELRFEYLALIGTWSVGLMGVSEQETKEQDFEFGFECPWIGI